MFAIPSMSFYDCVCAYVVRTRVHVMSVSFPVSAFVFVSFDLFP